MPTTLEANKTYEVTHSRKGKFTGRVIYVDSEWAKILIASGRASAMVAGNERDVGEEVDVRLSLCTFKEVA